jgi:hypothetical protein
MSCLHRFSLDCSINFVCTKIWQEEEEEVVDEKKLIVEDRAAISFRYWMHKATITTPCTNDTEVHPWMSIPREYRITNPNASGGRSPGLLHSACHQSTDSQSFLREVTARQKHMQDAFRLRGDYSDGREHCGLGPFLSMPALQSTTWFDRGYQTMLGPRHPGRMHTYFCQEVTWSRC